MTIEEFTQLLTALKNIIDAFHEQNYMNAAWMVEQREWHEQDIGPQIVAIHEKNAVREEEWRQEQKELLETQSRRQDKLIQQAHEAYLKHLVQQKYVLSETIDTLCEKAGVAKPAWDSTERRP